MPDALQQAREACKSFLNSERARGATIVLDIVEPYIAALEADRDRWQWVARCLCDETRAVDLYYIVPDARIGDCEDALTRLLARADVALKEKP